MEIGVIPADKGPYQVPVDLAQVLTEAAHWMVAAGPGAVDQALELQEVERQIEAGEFSLRRRDPDSRPANACAHDIPLSLPCILCERSS